MYVVMDTFLIVLSNEEAGIMQPVWWLGHWLGDAEGITEFSLSLNAQTGSGAHSASFSVGTGVLFWAVKRLGPEA